MQILITFFKSTTPLQLNSVLSTFVLPQQSVPTSVRQDQDLVPECCGDRSRVNHVAAAPLHTHSPSTHDSTEAKTQGYAHNSTCSVYTVPKNPPIFPRSTSNRKFPATSDTSKSVMALHTRRSWVHDPTEAKNAMLRTQFDWQRIHGAKESPHLSPLDLELKLPRNFRHKQKCYSHCWPR